MRLISSTLGLALALAVSACQPAMEQKTTMNEPADETKETPATIATKDDPRLWLEEVEGKKALNWVKAQNRRTLAGLQSDPRYQTLFDEALGIVNATDKIAYGAHRGGYVYNFWQDATNTHGLWRRTTQADYIAGNPKWDVLLDIDALSKTENENWVYKGVNCLSPTYERCMISLSRGGKDAAVMREFDVASKSFVKDGFIIPEAKGGAAWEDENTLLVATDWGDDTMTTSGYPFVDKRWTRGTPLADAVEVVRGDKTDVGVWPFRVELNDQAVMFASEADTFYETTYWWLPKDSKPVQVPLPAKSSVKDVFKGQAIISLEEDWTPNADGPTFAKGALVSYALQDFMDTKTITNVALVVEPDARSSIGSVSAAQSKLVVNMLQNVASVVYAYDFDGKTWSRKKLDLPENEAISITSINAHSDVFFANVEGFLRPDSLMAYDLNRDSATTIYALPERFDASDMVVEQQEAVSKDGTRVPYFIVHKKGMKHDGTAPTLLYGYGGFQVSMRPSYSGTLGKLWLEKGGVYVLANIRGGGEFGPKWHQAGLKTKRQVIYDDFIAVAEDLIAKKITTPRHLGIRGGSNGGLLMGVMYTQRPDLFNAVLCQVPLLDMLRFNKLLAGASWMGEYGDPDDPVEGAFLRSISPYHNVDPAKDYPQIFLMTSTKDDRVHPGHARKFGKLLEDENKDFLYYENTDGGHSAAANLKETARREALGYTYLMQKLMD
jgi:prolyl oligopeptidase